MTCLNELVPTLTLTPSYNHGHPFKDEESNWNILTDYNIYKYVDHLLVIDKKFFKNIYIYKYVYYLIIDVNKINLKAILELFPDIKNIKFTKKIEEIYFDFEDYIINLNSLLIKYPLIKNIKFTKNNEKLYFEDYKKKLKNITLEFNNENKNICTQDLKNYFHCIFNSNGIKISLIDENDDNKYSEQLKKEKKNIYICKTCKKQVFSLHKNYKKKRNNKCSKCYNISSK